VSQTEVFLFFETYRDAFNRLDGDAVADLWHTPSGIADAKPDAHGLPAAQLTWWPEEAAMRSNHRALCEVYRSASYGRADFEISHHQALGHHHATALLRWTITRKDGSVLQRFGTHYHLMRTTQGPRVMLCTAFEEDLQAMSHPPSVGPASAQGRQ
jgi:hypothetical protein